MACITQLIGVPMFQKFRRKKKKVHQPENTKHDNLLQQNTQQFNTMQISRI